MYNSNIPADRELPSTQKLVKSTIGAAVVAVTLLITTVLPSEYGIDPTGIGNALGLKKMGEIKVSLAEEVEAEKRAKVSMEAVAKVEPAAKMLVEEVVAESRSDSMTFSIAPNQGIEIKAKMKKGETVTYDWQSTDGKINFDVHGDSKKLKIRYHNYEKGSVITKEGEVTAAFDGSHGWFWRNRSGKTASITLNVSGNYESLDRVQ